MLDPVPCFILFMHPDGKLSWKTTLPLPHLNLALDGIKADLIAGRVEQSQLAKPTNGEIAAVNRIVTP